MQIDPSELLSIGIVGVGLSTLIEYIKNKYGTTSGTTKALTIVLALVVGGLYFWIRSTPFWLPVLGVLTVSSTVYAFFLK